MVRSFPHRPAFDDALVWLEMMGDAPDAVERWTQAKAARGERPHGHAHGHQRGEPRPAGHGHADHDGPTPAEGGVPADGQPRRRRRRRRRGRRRGGGNVA